MAYNEAHSELRHHPKTRRLKRLLGINTLTAIGLLQCLWWDTMTYSPNGDLTRFPADEIADWCEWEGDPEELIDALLNAKFGEGVGFLERTEDGRLVIHDWWQYGGKVVVKRWRDNFRKRFKRTPTIAEMRAANLPLPPDGIPLDEEGSLHSSPSSQDSTRNSDGTPTEFPRRGDGIPTDRAGREAKRSVAEQSIAKQSVSPGLAAGGSGGSDPPLPLPPARNGSSRSQKRDRAAERAFVEKTLAEFPHWREHLEQRREDADPSDADAYALAVVRGWLEGDGTPPEPAAAVLTTAMVPSRASPNGESPPGKMRPGARLSAGDRIADINRRTVEAAMNAGIVGTNPPKPGAVP